jgi:hypothetical protein
MAMRAIHREEWLLQQQVVRDDSIHVIRSDDVIERGRQTGEDYQQALHGRTGWGDPPFTCYF